MRHTPVPRILPSEITDEASWLTRREWLQRTGMASLVAGTAGLLPATVRAAKVENDRPALPATPNAELSTDESLTPEEDVISYNNFYEFGTDKADPSRRGHRMLAEPWTVRVEGEVLKPRTYGIDDPLKLAPREERTSGWGCAGGGSGGFPCVGFGLLRWLEEC